MEWQPIETAPEVGLFLAYDPDIGVCLCERYFYDGEHVCLTTEFGGGGGEYDDDACTHWMPLPTAPVAH